MKKYIKKNMKKMIVAWISIICIVSFWVFAYDFYLLQPGYDSCLVWPNGLRYGMTYNPPFSLWLFVPKRTTGELASFFTLATGINSFYVSDAYLYDEQDNPSICWGSTWCNNHGTVQNIHQPERPDTYTWWECVTACGTVECSSQ